MFYRDKQAKAIEGRFSFCYTRLVSLRKCAQACHKEALIISTNNWRPQKRQRREKPQGPYYRMYNVAMSFGLTLAISLFIMIKLGRWLDERFGTGFIFTFICLVMAIISGFRYLYELVLRMEEDDKKRDETDE